MGLDVGALLPPFYHSAAGDRVSEVVGVFESDVPTIIATRHGADDVEYLFAVNATPDENATDDKGNPERVTPKAVTATIRLPDNGRPIIYDAVVGGFVPELKGDRLTGQFRFGPGEMRVFARTRRPIRMTAARLTPRTGPRGRP